MKKKIYDTLIIGAGIYGINIARLLSKKYPEMKIALLESSKTLFHNNSIYNSGVLHSGLYYKPGSLKAKFCVKGQKELTEYCDQHQFAINKCGKVVVGTKEEYPVIEKLYNNGLTNNVNVSLVDLKTAQQFDKHIQTDAEKLIYVPSTAIVSPRQIYKSVLDQIVDNKNIDLMLNKKVLNLLNKNEFQLDRLKFRDYFSLLTQDNEIIYAKNVINCSGPSSDKIAKLFGHCQTYQNVHLKAIYHKYKLNETNMPSILVYPIPGPFSLGLHLTMEDSTSLKFGPSVDFPMMTPRDVSYNYSDFIWKNYELFKAFTIFKNYSQILTEFKNNSYSFGLKRLMRIYNRYVVKDLKFVEKKVLIRTPVMNTITGIFESDFIIEKSKNNIHLINFQSPAFTCFLPLSRHIVEEFEKNI